MLCQPFNVLMESFIFSSIQASSLILQVKEKLILISKLIQNVIIGVFGSTIGKELESSVSFVMLEHFHNLLLFFVKSAFHRKQVLNSGEDLESVAYHVALPSFKKAVVFCLQ